MPALSLGSSAIGGSAAPMSPSTAASASASLVYPSTSHANTHTLSTSPPPPSSSSSLGLSAQYTNPYLSHTTYGSSPLISGTGFEDNTQQQHHAQHAQAAHAQALVAAYYPYHLHGFLGPGFILGHVPSPSTTTTNPTEPDSTPSASASSLPLLSTPSSSSNSSCPSPLLTSTIERRRSKPHVQFIPSTHSVTSTGLVLPVIPPIAANGEGGLHGNKKGGRVPHAFNLFGLPPVFIYEIRIPPHVYLLTGLILYAIGPPALIPLVVCFFFYRWHLQRQTPTGTVAHAAALGHASMVDGGKMPPGGGVVGEDAGHAGAGMGAAVGTPAKHPSGMPKSTQRRHPNIHSLYDT